MIKNIKYLPLLPIALLLVMNMPFITAQPIGKKKSQQNLSKTFPDSIECVVRPYYRHRADRTPGREVMVYFRGHKFAGKGELEINCSGKIEKLPVEVIEASDSLPVLLPSGAGVTSDEALKITLRSSGHELTASVTVPAKRLWTVYIYPHSHVDIGYTNTQENVEIIHKRNLINGIELAKKTVNYPDGAKYLWNPEVLWPVERYLSTANAEEKQNIIDAVRKGYLHLDAGYIHTNTTTSADEELFEFFRQSSFMKKITGRNIETLVQVDIPGMSWGVVPVAARLGIKYCLAMNNGSDRVGLSTDLSFRPFWWLSPDGKSKILFMQPGSYNPGAIYKGFAYWPLMAGQTDPSKLLQIVKTDNPRANFIDKYLEEKLPMLEKSDYYPYDIFPMSWAMADNTPIDADLPEAVKSWNEDYAYPHLVIASATEIMKAFETKYGDQLPVLTGDFTEYWTDGLGSAARQTAMNRASKERLIQVETLWTLLNPGVPAPRKEIEEAWRNIILGTEHTWCFMDPKRQPITNDILKVKFGYFQKGEDMSKSLMDSVLSAVNEPGSKRIGVFNPLSWKRGGCVYLSPEQSKNFNSVVDEEGNKGLSQRLSTGELVFFAGEVDALSSKTFILKGKKSKTQGKIAAANILDNGILHVVIDTLTGDISSMKSADHEYVSDDKGTGLNKFRYLRGNDSPEKASGTSGVKIKIKENGPLLATLEITSVAEGTNGLSREITLASGAQHLEITNTIDKIAVTEKEGIHFGYDFNVPRPVTRFDIPWGIVELEKDQLSAGNRNWIAFQRWLDISNNDNGVTFCSLDAPVFESGTITANVLGAATNSPEWIRKLEPSSTIYSWALNNHWHTNFPLSQEGVLRFRYRILPHNTGYDASEANRFGLEQAQPLIPIPVKEGDVMEPLLALQGNDRIFLTILKSGSAGEPAEIRLRSVSEKDEKVRLVWTGRKPSNVIYEDSGEKVIEEVSVPAKGFVTLNVTW